MLEGMVIINGLKGLVEKFCSNKRLKKNVNKDGP